MEQIRHCHELFSHCAVVSCILSPWNSDKMIGGMAAAAMASIASKKMDKPSKEDVETSVPKDVDYKLNEPTNNYVCERCPAKFSRRYNRDRHVELVHKIPRPGKSALFPKIINDETVEVVPLKRSLAAGDLTTSPDLQSTTINSEPKKVRLNRPKVSAPEQPETADKEEEMKGVNNECKAEDDNVNVIQFPLSKEVTITVFVTSKWKYYVRVLYIWNTIAVKWGHCADKKMLKQNNLHLFVQKQV